MFSAADNVIRLTNVLLRSLFSDDIYSFNKNLPKKLQVAPKNTYISYEAVFF